MLTEYIHKHEKTPTTRQKAHWAKAKSIFRKGRPHWTRLGSQHLCSLGEKPFTSILSNTEQPGAYSAFCNMAARDILSICSSLQWRLYLPMQQMRGWELKARFSSDPQKTFVWFMRCVTPLVWREPPPQLPSLSSPLISACCYAKGANLRTDSSEKKAIKKKKAPYFRNLNNKPCDQNNS